MLKKAFIVVIVLCVIGSLGGVFLAGLNIYTRSTTLQEEAATSTEAPAVTPAPTTQGQ